MYGLPSCSIPSMTARDKVMNTDYKLTTFTSSLIVSSQFDHVAAREAAIWELEEKQLQEKHQLAKRQLKDFFFLKRHQMLTRHEKVCMNTTLKHKKYYITWT